MTQLSVAKTELTRKQTELNTAKEQLSEKETELNIAKEQLSAAREDSQGSVSPDFQAASDGGVCADRSDWSDRGD